MHGWCTGACNIAPVHRLAKAGKGDEYVNCFPLLKGGGKHTGGGQKPADSKQDQWWVCVNCKEKRTYDEYSPAHTRDGTACPWSCLHVEEGRPKRKQKVSPSEPVLHACSPSAGSPSPCIPVQEGRAKRKQKASPSELVSSDRPASGAADTSAEQCAAATDLDEETRVNEAVANREWATQLIEVSKEKVKPLPARHVTPLRQAVQANQTTSGDATGAAPADDPSEPVSSNRPAAGACRHPPRIRRTMGTAAYTFPPHPRLQRDVHLDEECELRRVEGGLEGMSTSASASSSVAAPSSCTPEDGRAKRKQKASPSEPESHPRLQRDVDPDEECELRRLEGGLEGMSTPASASSFVPAPSSMLDASTGGEVRLRTIAVNDLDPYLITRNRQLVVRVMGLRQRRFENSRGPGTVSSVHVADSTGDVELAFFNQEALFDRLRVGLAIYVPLEKAQIRPEKRFNKTRSPFSVTLGPNVEIREVHRIAAERARLPIHASRFVSVASLASESDGTCVDILGIVIDLSAPSTFIRKVNGETGATTGRKQIFTVADLSERKVPITCFLKDGESLSVEYGTIVAARCRVERFRGVVTLKAGFDEVVHSPKFPEAEEVAAFRNRLPSPWDPAPLEQTWQFTSIKDLASKPLGSHVDVRGVICNKKVTMKRVAAACTCCCTACPAHTYLRGNVFAAIQGAFDYTSKGGQAGRREIVEVTDASRYGVPVTVFSQASGSAALAVGNVVCLHAIVEAWQHQLALKVFDGGFCCDTPDGDDLCVRYQHERWVPQALPKQWKFASLDTLADQAVDARVDVLGVVVALEVRHVRVGEGMFTAMLLIPPHAFTQGVSCLLKNACESRCFSLLSSSHARTATRASGAISK